MSRHTLLNMLRIAGLASVATASVLPRAPGMAVDLPLWESMRYAHAAMFCSFGDEDLATSDGAMKVWQGNGIGTVLDKFISDQGKKPLLPLLVIHDGD